MALVFPNTPTEGTISVDGAYRWTANRWKAIGGSITLPPTPDPPTIPTEVHPGTVAYHAGSIPPGWLHCDGSQVSRTAYAGLFASIGTYYGAGNGSTTFNLPDTRSDFIRCYHHGAGIDVGHTFGTRQGDEIRANTYAVITGAYVVAVGPYPIYTTAPVSIGGIETRPVNTAFWGIIKY